MGVSTARVRRFVTVVPCELGERWDVAKGDEIEAAREDGRRAGVVEDRPWVELQIGSELIVVDEASEVAILLEVDEPHLHDGEGGGGEVEARGGSGAAEVGAE